MSPDFAAQPTIAKITRIRQDHSRELHRYRVNVVAGLPFLNSKQLFLHRTILINVKNVQTLTPGLLLIIGNLAQIKHRLLYDTTVSHPAVFDDTVVPMNRAILLSLVTSEKHNAIVSDKNTPATPKVSTTTTLRKKSSLTVQEKRKIFLKSHLFAKSEKFGLTNEFGFWGVMGADEFHMMVHNNCYTNVMAKKSFEFALKVMDEMKRYAPDALKKVIEKIRLKPNEPKDWRQKARKMRIPQNKKTGIFEQHDGYFNMPHLDVKSIPPTQFPLYNHWAYVRLFRYDMIKQLDVLLLPFFFSHEYSPQIKKENYEYHEPRCSHESSLSPSIHAILAAELGKHDAAYRYSIHAARLDLDDYNNNTSHGLHITSMAGAWLNIVYGFGGMRSDGDTLTFNPSIPKKWKSFSFRILYKNSVLVTIVDKINISLCIIKGKPVTVKVFGKRITITTSGKTISLPAHRRA